MKRLALIAAVFTLAGGCGGDSAREESLEARLTRTQVALREAKESLRAERRRLDLFRESVADLAQTDMLNKVRSAARIGALAASDCHAGYTDPACEFWYSPEAEVWAWRQVRRFTLSDEVKRYGKDLVSRVERRVEEIMALSGGD